MYTQLGGPMWKMFEEKNSTLFFPADSSGEGG